MKLVHDMYGRSTNTTWSDIGVLSLCGMGLALLAVLVVFLVYLMGYGFGIYSAACAIDSSQPQCVAAGWQNQHKINGNLNVNLRQAK